MVPPIPIEHREEIVRLRDAGYSFRNIRDLLMQKGVKYSVIGIGNCYQKIIKNGSIDAQPKQKYSKEMLERIKHELQTILEENSDLTGQQQIDEIKRRLGVIVSMDAVGRYRRMLGWKVMPIASNKLSQSSTLPSSSSASSDSSAFNSTVLNKSGNNVNVNNDSMIDRDSISNNDNSQLQATTSNIGRTNGGYYLHPPDVILPPGLDLSSESGNNRASLQIANVVTKSASGSHQQTNEIKSEYENESNSLPTTSTSISSHLQHQQIHIINAVNNNSQISPSSSSNAQNIVSNGTLMNTAIVYPLKPSPARFGPMHVFTSRAIIKTGSGTPGLKYQVWAGISYQGATSICIWDANCRMRSSFYCNTILEKFFLPFRTERYSNKRCILVQSNDTIYRSVETKTYMEHHAINYETWINGRYGDENNPIELIWDEINDHIRSEVKPQCLDTLREAICNFWATKMTDSKCRQCLKKCSIFSEY